MGSILSVSWARASGSPWWPKLETQKNYTCIIMGLRPFFWYNIHGVYLVCELSNRHSQTSKQTNRIVYYCPRPANVRLGENYPLQIGLSTIKKGHVYLEDLEPFYWCLYAGATCTLVPIYSQHLFIGVYIQVLPINCCLYAGADFKCLSIYRCRL